MGGRGSDQRGRGLGVRGLYDNTDGEWRTKCSALLVNQVPGTGRDEGEEILINTHVCMHTHTHTQA